MFIEKIVRNRVIIVMFIKLALIIRVITVTIKSRMHRQKGISEILRNKAQRQAVVVVAVAMESIKVAVTA
jgi:hypothetical protein